MQKKQLLARERRLEPPKLFELCRKRGINIGTNPRENSYDTILQNLLDDLDDNIETIKIAQRIVKVDRERKTLFYVNNLISSEHVHMLCCREHSISWRKEVKSVSKQDEKDRTRAELICDILADGHEVPKGRLRHEDLVKIASKYGIATKKDGA